MAAAAAASPAAAAAACCFVLYGRSAPLTSIGRTDGLAADCIGVRCPPRLAAVSTWLHWELSNWGHAALPTARVRPAAGGFPGRPAAQRRLRPPPSPAGRRGGHCKHLLRHDPHLRRAGRLGLGLVHRRPARHRGHLGSQGHLRLPAVSAWEGKLRRRERLRSLPCPPGRGAETAANGPGEQGVRLHSMMRTMGCLLLRPGVRWAPAPAVVRGRRQQLSNMWTGQSMQPCARSLIRPAAATLLPAAGAAASGPRAWCS